MLAHVRSKHSNARSAPHWGESISPCGVGSLAAVPQCGVSAIGPGDADSGRRYRVVHQVRITSISRRPRSSFSKRRRHERQQANHIELGPQASSVGHWGKATAAKLAPKLAPDCW